MARLIGDAYVVVTGKCPATGESGRVLEERDRVLLKRPRSMSEKEPERLESDASDDKSLDDYVDLEVLLEEVERR